MSSEMSNPWIELPASAPFVLPDDQAILQFFKPRNPRAAVHTELLPEPFVGNPEAPVILLNLNPGFSEKDAAAHACEKFTERLRSNLKHEKIPHPFYLLDPELPSPGQEWWKRYLKKLETEVGLEAITSGICCIEFFPYHSDRYSGATPRIRSQDYSFQLVRRALRRHAVVVIMRSYRRWIEAVPELATYSNLFTLRNPQRVYVTPGNCPAGFPMIVDRLLAPRVSDRND